MDNDNKSSTVLQNTTNVYGDVSTLHAFFQRHKRPSDDGTNGPLNKKPRIEMATETREAETESPIEDAVEDVRVPRTNTFKMLRNIYRARNVFAQPSSAYPDSSGGTSGQKLTVAISTNKQDTGELRLIREGGHILLSLGQGWCLYLAAIHLCLLQW